MCCSGRGVPFGVTNPCGRSKSQKLSPKANNTFDGHCPQKHLFMGGFFSNPQAVCLLWDQRTHTALFLQVTWAVFKTCSHIEERCAPLTHTHTKLHILNKKHQTTKITTLSILLKLEEKKRSYVLLNFGKNFNMWLTMFNFFNKIFWLIIYIFMIKIIFNFKRNYIYALMHALHAIFLIIIWLIIYIFIIKIVFYFKYIHASAWGTC